MDTRWAYTDLQKAMWSRIDPNHWEALKNLFSERDEDYEYMDNERVFAVGDFEGQALFEEAREEGCCGSSDESVTIGATTYRLGFNYGH